ncbi:unnamed protein product [Polarella glacialis]|uniref:Kinesin motor domain-containing protein n=1 Tax=Polarella glacialis TaxID=89957 RepID=A0A813GBH5_POLGL|nr:unnamed protein product [Polarella glacialis]
MSMSVPPGVMAAASVSFDPAVAGAGGQGVRVVCRLRPMNEWEKRAGTVPAATASTERKEVAVVRMLGGGTRQVRSTFHFDDVLTSFSTQNEVFSSTLEPLIGEVLSGFEATAFAYGQTGTGKTYTMEGNLDSDEGRGLVPRAAASVFTQLAHVDYLDHTVTVSYLEIYNEELCDLLAAPHLHQKLDLKDVGSGRGVVCNGLSEVRVSNVDDILKLVSLAQERRRVAETRVNARSSRSHSIFTMKVRCRKAVVGGCGELENIGKLHLVDLAGSENAKKASQCFLDDGNIAPSASFASQALRAGQHGAGDEERERRNINQSLLTLGRVINALREGSGRVPYRDSKLTRLLQDALGGRCKTVIIATISPALGAVEETISTLTYAEQACGIKNRPVATSLFRTVRQGGNGDTNANSVSGCEYAELELKAAYLAQEVEEAQAALARQYREAQENAERALAAEARLGEAEVELGRKKREAEEQTYARHRLAAYADTQYDASGKLALALDATTAHGEDLTRRLAGRCSEAAAIKQQAREVCTEAEANATALTEATKSRAKEVAAAVAETYAAHRQATGVAAEITQEQQRILNDLLALLQKDVVCKLLGGSPSAKGASLEENLRALVAEARGALGAAGEATSAALGAAASALGQAGLEAGSLEKALLAAAARHQAAIEERCQRVGTEMQAARAALVAGASDATDALQLACLQSRKNGEELEQRLESTGRSPLAQLTAGGLEESSGQASQLLEGLAALLAHETGEEEPGTAQRWSTVLAALAACASRHEELAAVGGPQQALREALKKLQAELEAGADSTGSALKSASERLTAGQAVLDAASKTGLAAVTTKIGEADALLADAWGQQLGMLDALDSDLAEASRDQTASHAAQDIQQCADAAARDLVGSLATAVTSLAATRQQITREVAELEKQRAAEQAAVELLTKQREALQQDVSGLQASLATLGRELDLGRGQLASVQAAQQQGRERVLEAIISAAKSGLATLGQGLETGSAELNGHLNAATALSTEVASNAATAAERSGVFGSEVAAVVADWSQCVGSGCNTISKAQERAEEAAKDVATASGIAKGQFDCVGAMATEWGSGCDRVSALLESATKTHASDLRAAEGHLRPEWKTLREDATQAAETWANGIHQASSELGQASNYSAAASEALFGAKGASDGNGLRGTVARRRAQAEEQAACWEAGAAEHGTDLASLSAEAAQLKTKEADAAERRACCVTQLREQASILQSGAAQNCVAARTVVQGLEALTLPTDSAPLPAARRAAEAALTAGGMAVESLAAKAGSSMVAGAEEVTIGLCGAQAAAFQELGASVSEAAQSLYAAAENAAAAASHGEQASTADMERGLGFWHSAEDLRSKAVGAITASMDSAKNEAASATRAGSEQVLATLEKGGAARERAGAAATGMAAGAASALAQHQAALRQGLAGEPLAAFSETTEEEQKRGIRGMPARPETAERPNVNLRPRPRDEDLAAEFRNGGVAVAPKHPDPVVLPNSAVRRQASETDIWVDRDVDTENFCVNTVLGAATAKSRKPSPAKREAAKATPRSAASKGPTPTSRSVLGEVNRPGF